MTNHEDLKDFLDAFTDLFFKLSSDGAILEYRGGKNTSTYVSPEVFIGKRIQDVMPDEVAGKLLVALEDLKKIGTMVTVEYALMQNNQLGYFEARLVPYGASDVVVNVRDITAQREAEQALNESEKKYAELINQSSALLFALDPENFIITFVSNNIIRYGYSVDEVVQKSLADFIHPDDLNTVYAELRLALEGKKQKDVIFRFRLNDGTWRTMEESGKVATDQSGIKLTYTGILRDVTERMQNEDDRVLLAKMESLGLLAGGIAHDFNNLLCVISANISFVMDEPISSTVKEGLQEAYNASRRAAELTKQLLTYSKGGAPEKKLISLDKVVSETAGFCLHGSSVDLAIDHEDLWPVDADEGQIAQVVQNIVINAKQAMPEGGVICINLTNLRDMDGSEWVCMEIKDNGPGIPYKHRSKIFDPYFTTKQSGSGLGLAVTFSIVKKHGGRMDVSSIIGKGTAFTILLPASRGVLISDRDELVDDVDTRIGKILIMDDELPVAKVISRILTRRGHTVEITADGEAAIEAYLDAFRSHEPYDMVFVDLTVVGGMGGKLTAKEILKINPDALIVVSSGYAEGDVLQNYEKYGFVAALPKPINSKNLERLVSKLLR